MKYSKSTLGFYDDLVHVDLPFDAVFVSDSDYTLYQEKISQGFTLIAGAGDYPEFEKIEDGSSEKISICTPAQGLVALFALKQITEDGIQDKIDLIPDPVKKYNAQIAFKRAITWDRESQTIQTIASLLNLSDSDLDDLFEYAATVNA